MYVKGGSILQNVGQSHDFPFCFKNTIGLWSLLKYPTYN